MENLFDRPAGGERAVLVHIDFPQEDAREDPVEFEMLVESAGAVNCGLIRGSRPSPDARLFIGKGKVEELARYVEDEEAELVIFNHTLSPSQERNLEREL